MLDRPAGGVVAILMAQHERVNAALPVIGDRAAAIVGAVHLHVRRREGERLRRTLPLLLPLFSPLLRLLRPLLRTLLPFLRVFLPFLIYALTSFSLLVVAMAIFQTCLTHAALTYTVSCLVI